MSKTQPSQPSQPSVDVADAMRRVGQIVQELNSRYLERGDEINLLVACALGRQHGLLLGPAGEGKSGLVDAFTARIQGAKLFKTMLQEQTKQEELNGLLSIDAFKQGRYERDIDLMLPDAHIAFLDEIFKAHSTLLNGFLLMMNERQFRQGKQLISVPLESMIGASNEIPTGDEGARLAPFWDRFALRTWVKPLSAAGRRVFVDDEMARRQVAATTGADTSGQRGTTITLPELKALQRATLAVVIPGGVRETYWKIEQQMEVQGIPLPSTRRLGWLWNMVAAHALMSGRTTATDDDLSILRYALWQDRQQIKPVNVLVMEAASPITAKAQKVFDKIMGEIEDVIRDERNVTDPASEAAHAQKLVVVQNHIGIALKDLKSHRDEALGAGRDAGEINQMGMELNGKQAALLAKYAPKTTW